MSVRLFVRRVNVSTSSSEDSPMASMLFVKLFFLSLSYSEHFSIKYMLIKEIFLIVLRLVSLSLVASISVAFQYI